jgi:peptidoglycan/LPS O-acetylase OafA/YrhL
VRNRYLDFLRAAAIVRVIVYHLFGWPWLSIVLPAMGVMFALAGSLTAASLEKRSARQVVTSRLRRLLPPLWLLGLLAVPVMVFLGWAHERHGDHPFDLLHSWHLLFWIFPLGDPPGSQKAVDLWEPLWYIRAYVWFILLSPVMYAAYRKIGWFAVVAPIVAIGVLDKTGFSLPDTADAAMWDFVTFAACWMTGFAHHDGRLRRVRPGLVVFGALVLGGAAMYWLQGHQGSDPWDLNDVSESQALWSLGFVLIALRWEPSMAWLERWRPLDKLVTFLNARAVTIYLWHNLAITAVWPLLSLIALDDIGHHLDDPVDLLTAFALTLVAVLAFGWVEDLAARRRPRFWPAGAPALRPARIPAGDQTPALAGAYPAGGTDPARQLPEGPAGDDGLPPWARQHRPQGRRPVPWAADVPALDAGPAGFAADPGLAIAGPVRPVIAQAPPPSGRHAAGEPETAGTLDLGLPVAGRRAVPRSAEGPLEGQIVDGPPAPWPHPRQPEANWQQAERNSDLS